MPGALSTRRQRPGDTEMVTCLMGTADSGHVQMLLGAYILGGLSECEEFSVRSHLGRCLRCRFEYDDLAVLPAVLDLFAEELEAGGDAGGFDG